ncbi:hypothetical protein OE88DRAFT_304327 [Heliocybe sulcata]|uniref:Uncharacterized protein n=1 Tax=Heliocybe sulcata TaxID=5364 RepID=A0A5C3N1Q4_9AGAM|nr:hypothetical protein OE88DRAFT_304327 [Heliocybe sulcata]
MTSTDYAPYWIHPRIPFNSAFDSTNPTHMSPGFPEDMVASSYLSTVPASSINHGTEPTMLDHFMSSMANPNGSVGFYADDWQGTTRAGASWNNLGDPGTSGFHGSVNAGWSAAPTGAE